MVPPIQELFDFYQNELSKAVVVFHVGKLVSCVRTSGFVVQLLVPAFNLAQEGLVKLELTTRSAMTGRHGVK